MAKKQTRRSISVRGSTYRRLQVYCDAEGISVSDQVERLVAPLLEQIADPGTQAPRAAAPPPPPAPPAPARGHSAQLARAREVLAAKRSAARQADQPPAAREPAIPRPGRPMAPHEPSRSERIGRETRDRPEIPAGTSSPAAAARPPSSALPASRAAAPEGATDHRRIVF